MRAKVLCLIGLILAGSGALAQSRAIDPISARFTDLTVGEYIAVTRIGNALAAQCRKVRRRKSIPSSAAREVIFARLHKSSKPGDQIVIDAGGDERVYVRFFKRYGLEPGPFGKKACSIAAQEKKENTLIGALLR